jgi:hypothetical protein
MLIDGKIADKKRVVYLGIESMWERIRMVNNAVTYLRLKHQHKIDKHQSENGHQITFYAIESSKINKK